MAAKQQGMNPANTQLLIFAGFGLLFYNKIFGKSEETKAAEAEEKKLDDAPLEKNPLMQTYKPKAPSKKLQQQGYWILRTKNDVGKNQALMGAREVKKAIGTFTDDESAIVNAMKRAVTKSEINLISRLYAALYKRDLNYDLKDNVGKKELLPIFSYINKLPDFTKR